MATLDKIREFQGYDLLYLFTEGSVAILGDYSEHRTHAIWPGGGNNPTWAAGSGVGRALDFDHAVPQYLSVTCPQLDYTFQDFSCVARVRINDTTGNTAVIFRGLYNTDGWCFFCYEATRLLAVQTAQAGATQQTFGPVIELDTWYTMGFSRRGASVRCYLNGIDHTSPGAHQNPLSNPARVAGIGVSSDLINNGLDGRMEFLGVWGRALEAEEHRTLHRILI